MSQQKVIVYLQLFSESAASKQFLSYQCATMRFGTMTLLFLSVISFGQA